MGHVPICLHRRRNTCRQNGQVRWASFSCLDKLVCDVVLNVHLAQCNSPDRSCILYHVLLRVMRRTETASNRRNTMCIVMKSEHSDKSMHNNNSSIKGNTREEHREWEYNLPEHVSEQPMLYCILFGNADIIWN